MQPAFAVSPSTAIGSVIPAASPCGARHKDAARLVGTRMNGLLEATHQRLGLRNSQVVEINGQAEVIGRDGERLGTIIGLVVREGILI